MLASFILGLAAGAVAPHAAPHVSKALGNIDLPGPPVGETELRLLSLAVCLVAASVLAHAFGDGSAFALSLGALIGVLGPRILDRVQKRRAPDYGPDPE